MDKALLDELQSRFEIDQAFTEWGEEYEENCAKNSDWIKSIFEKDGWLFAESEQAELCAWIFVAHGPDWEFKRHLLGILKELPVNKARNEFIALLEDKILVHDGQPQLYGSQFDGDEPFPIFDPNNLDQRRAKMDMIPFKEYKKALLSK